MSKQKLPNPEQQSESILKLTIQNDTDYKLYLVDLKWWHEWCRFTGYSKVGGPLPFTFNQKLNIVQKHQFLIQDQVLANNNQSGDLYSESQVSNNKGGVNSIKNFNELISKSPNNL